MSSFDVEWFGEVVLPQIDPSVPVLSVTKGLMNLEAGTLLTYLDVWENMLAQKGEADLSDFPLLLHIDEIITQNAPVNIPGKSSLLKNKANTLMKMLPS